MWRKASLLALSVGMGLWAWGSLLPAALAQEPGVTLNDAKREARALKFQIGKLRQQLTVLSTQVNQINNLTVRIRSVLGEILNPAAASRSQGQVRIALQHAITALQAIDCALPQPPSELECKFKTADGENLGILEMVRDVMSGPEGSLTARIEALRAIVAALKDAGLLSAAAASKINSQLNKIAIGVETIDAILNDLELILSATPEEGIQPFLETVRSNLDQDEEVAWAEIKDARENASRAVGVARAPETGRPTFLRRALADIRRFSGLIRKLVIDFTPIPAQLRATGRSSFLVQPTSGQIVALFDLSGRTITEPSRWVGAQDALERPSAGRSEISQTAEGIYIAVIVARDAAGRVRASWVQKIRIKI
jgi:hypothetical protein